MPAVSTNTSTLSGVAYCWSFQLMTTWNPARYVLLARSAGWTYARIPITWLKPLWLRSPFWFKQSLANFSSGLDALVFIHLMVARGCCCWLGTVSLTINQSFLQPKTPRKHWGFLGFFLRCQFGDSAYTHPWGVPRPNTLVDSQLHQMHLMHPTWFNGAHHMWRKTSGGHSFTESIMLKRSPGSKVYRVPSSAIELPQGSFQHVILWLSAAASLMGWSYMAL